VPATIAKLIESNIRVWVLTGDKQETAIEIGKSCHLIQENMKLEILTPEPHVKDQQRVFNHNLMQLANAYEIDWQETTTDLTAISKKVEGRQRLALVIDGPTLAFALNNEEILKIFFRVCLHAASVICCRVSPK
jgi:magnesium-transporting ATPase (P-type)